MLLYVAMARRLKNVNDPERDVGGEVSRFDQAYKVKGERPDKNRTDWTNHVTLPPLDFRCLSRRADKINQV